MCQSSYVYRLLMGGGPSVPRLEPPSDDRNMYELPSLRKTAYYACNKIERAKFDLNRLPLDLRLCCESLFKILKDDRKRNDGDGRETMHSRVKYLPSYQPLCEAAAMFGHIDCLRLLRAIGTPWQPWSTSSIIPGPTIFGEACELAAQYGNLKCLRYARENGSPCRSDRTCTNAASYGHLDCLRYARENGCPLSSNACNGAARNDHLKCLAYARENGCYWGKATCEGAARNGHLNCLVYARENGCEWDKDKCKRAAMEGFKMCYMDAHLNGRPWDQWTKNIRRHMDCWDYCWEIGPLDESSYDMVSSMGYMAKNIKFD